MKNNVTLSRQGLRSFRIAFLTASMLLASFVLSFAQNRIDKSLIPFILNDGKLITLRDLTIHNSATITIPQTFIAGFTSDLRINFGNGTTQPLSSAVIVNGNAIWQNIALNVGDNAFSIGKFVQNPTTGVNRWEISAKLPTITFKPQQVPYSKPDVVWTISTAQTWQPPSSPYPSATSSEPDALFKSSNPRDAALLQQLKGSSIGKANAYIKFATNNTTGKLVKPVIIVDGLDFGSYVFHYEDATVTNPTDNTNKVIRYGDNGWDILQTGTDESRLDPNDPSDKDFVQNYPQFFSRLLNDGYDVVFVDFERGADYIQKNAWLVIELLRKINTEKLYKDCQHRSVVIGASMGGLITRYALRKMEQMNEDHQTDTYISFDAPQQGANIPLSVQGAALWADKAGLKTGALSLWQRLNLPAPRQLLKKHLGTEMQTINGAIAFKWDVNPAEPISIESMDYGGLRDQFDQELTTIGYPRNTRNVALACGSFIGSSQGYAAGSAIFNVDGKFAGSWADPRDPTLFAMKLYASGLTNDGIEVAKTSCSSTLSKIQIGLGNGYQSVGMNYSDVIFAAGMPVGFSQGDNPFPCQYNSFALRVNNPIHFDNAPGSYRQDLVAIKGLIEGAVLDLIPPKVKEDIDVDFKGLPGLVNKKQTFITMMSALGMNQAQDNTNLFQNFEINKTDLITSGVIPFADVFAPSINLKHVEVNTTMIEWIMSQIRMIGGNIPATLINQNYNFANQAVNEVPQISLTNGSTVRINGNGGAGLGSEVNNAPNTFTVSTSNRCLSSFIEVGVTGSTSRSTLQIGENTRIGILEVRKNSFVRIGANGTLTINNNSQLIIENGGRLIIEAGANLNLVGTESKIIIQQGGELIVNGQPIFTGNGHFRFEQGNTFTLNSNLSLTGVGRTNPIIRIAPGATIAVTNPFEWRVQDGAIVREPGSSNSKIVRSYIWLRNGSTFKAQNVLFDDQQTNPFGMPSGVFVSVEDPFDVSNDLNDVDYGFDNCIFQNTGIAVELNVPYAQSLPFDHRNINLEFRNSTFTNCQALRADRGYKTVFENCTLTKSNIDIAHTNWLNIRGTTMRYNPLAGSGRGVGTAIKARYVGHLWFRDGSLIDSWDTGIDDSEGGWNIITTASTIQSCGTGINLSGQLNSTIEVGLLLMNCARLIENDLGIKGQDVIFQASNTNIFTKNPNNLSGLFIESVFKDRQNIDTHLWFFGNYWGLTPPTNNDWLFRVKTGSPQPNLLYVPWVGTIHTDPVLTDSTNLAVRACGGVNLRGGDEDSLSKRTIVNINGILYDVKIQQDAGLNSLNQNNLVAAQSLLSPVAEIPNSIRDTASAAVKHFMSVSRSLTLRGGVQLRSNSKSAWLPEAIVGLAKSDNTLFVSPNPTTDQFDITLPYGDYDIQVFDARGKRILVKNTEGGISSVDVRTWHNGIYMVSLLDKTTKKKTFSKVIVQH